MRHNSKAGDLRPGDTFFWAGQFRLIRRVQLVEGAQIVIETAEQTGEGRFGPIWRTFVANIWFPVLAVTGGPA